MIDFSNFNESKSVNEKFVEHIYDLYYWKAVNYANTFLRDIEISKEITQDAFISLWEKRDSLDLSKNVECYLLAAVRNKVFNLLRKRQRVAKSMGQEVSITDRLNIIALNDSSSDKVISTELMQIINKTLKSMKPEISQTFLLCREEDLSYKEVAVRKNVSVKTVEYRISKALKIMRLALADYLPLLFFLNCMDFFS